MDIFTDCYLSIFYQKIAYDEKLNLNRIKRKQTNLFLHFLLKRR